AHGCVARLSREHAPQALKIKIFVNSAAEAGVLMQWLGQIPDDVQTVPTENRFRKDVVSLLKASVQVVRIRVREEGARMIACALQYMRQGLLCLIRRNSTL